SALPDLVSCPSGPIARGAGWPRSWRFVCVARPSGSNRAAQRNRPSCRNPCPRNRPGPSRRKPRGNRAGLRPAPGRLAHGLPLSRRLRKGRLQGACGGCCVSWRDSVCALNNAIAIRWPADAVCAPAHPAFPPPKRRLQPRDCPMPGTIPVLYCRPRLKGSTMNALRHLGGLTVAAVLAFSPPALATSYSGDVSDLWWVPTESGWGMQLVQEGSTVYATLFIYGPTTQPTWAGATLQSHGPGSYIWSGSLYVFTGPWFGSAFNPKMVASQQAGSMTFQLNTVSSGN